jgi:hypothetical protein
VFVAAWPDLVQARGGSHWAVQKPSGGIQPMRTDFHRVDGPAGTRAARCRHCRERRRPDKPSTIPEPVGRLGKKVWKGCFTEATRLPRQVFSMRLLSSDSIP